jgi:hypothetical protein
MAAKEEKLHVSTYVLQFLPFFSAGLDSKKKEEKRKRNTISR